MYSYVDVITTRIVLCRVPQKKKYCSRVQSYIKCNHLRRCPSHVSTDGTICLFWSPELDFGRNWLWWFQCTFDYGQTPSSTNPALFHLKTLLWGSEGNGNGIFVFVNMIFVKKILFKSTKLYQMQSPPSLYIPQFQLRELFVCFGRLNRILAEIVHGDFSV